MQGRSFIQSMSIPILATGKISLDNSPFLYNGFKNKLQRSIEK